VNRLLSVLSLLLFTSTISFGQNLLIEGAVTDVATKGPIANAIVTLACNDTAIETKTDDKGKYSFTFLKADKTYLIYAHSDNPVYGYTVGNEVYLSTYQLNHNPRTFIRNIVLSQNVTYALPPPPAIHVQFGFKGNTINNPDKDSAINCWLQYLLDNPSYVVEIDGYTDRKEGNKTWRMSLSRGRVQECIDYLHTHGIQYTRMHLMGCGSDSPVMSPKAIRRTKGKEAKMAARLLNCRAEIKLKNMFFSPPSIITLNGIVTDINLGTPVINAVVLFSGSDGTRVSTGTDTAGRFNMTVKNFNPLVFYSVTADARGYNSSDPEDIYKINPESNDQQIYSHNFRIEKNGYEKQPIFAPVMFDSGSAALSQITIDTLNRVKKLLQQRPGLVMEFMGDADYHEINYVKLSSERALACVSYLIKSGIDSARFVVASRLNEQSIENADHDTPGVVKHKERQRLFNHKACSVSFWPVNWRYGEKNPEQ
jgi:outer membrane protein OmpA-like peptidoglycan-associated protein